MRKDLHLFFNPKGKQYKVKTTEYTIQDLKSGRCLIYIHPSASIKEQPMDWIRNFKCQTIKTKIGDKDVYVHKGFLEAYNELIVDLYPKITRFKEISIAGYSHGGAVALILYVKALSLLNGVKINPPVIFGTPRIFSRFCNYKFIKSICKDVTTVKYGLDIVPYLPFWLGKVGDECKIKRDKKPQSPSEWLRAMFTDHGAYWNYFNKL